MFACSSSKDTDPLHGPLAEAFPRLIVRSGICGALGVSAGINVLDARGRE